MELSFNCWDKKEWESYINEVIIPIRKSGDILIRFWGYLSDNYSGLQMSDIKENKYLLEKLLGGVDISGGYKNRSSALFYKSFFGWELENVTSYLKNKEEGTEIEISTKINETIFIKFIKKLLEYCDKILYSAWEKGIISSHNIEGINGDFKRFIESEEYIIKSIGELYGYILKFSINYNVKTLFLWTVRKNTKRYICFQYKKLCEDNKIESLKNLVDFSIYYSPQLDEKSDIAEKISDEYSIWHFDEGGFGYNVCQLNNCVFESFKEEIYENAGYKKNPLWECFKFIVPNPKNFQKEYSERADRLLLTWKFPDYIQSTLYRGDNKHTYKINGLILSEHKWDIRTQYNHPWNQEGAKHYRGGGTVKPRWLSQRKECSISLLNVLDDLGPVLFLLDKIQINIDRGDLEIIDLKQGN